MSDLIERIKELEMKERQLATLKSSAFAKLESFVSSWDSNDPNQLPANRHAMINDVRDVLNYIIAISKPVVKD